MKIIKNLVPLLLLFAALQANAADSIWRSVDNNAARGIAGPIRHYQVDTTALRQQLQFASLRRAQDPVQIIRLPLPDGGMGRFEIEESPILHESIARRFPDVRTYKVYGIDDPTASGRLSLSANRFHAMLHTAKGRLLIDPESSAPGRYAARSRPSMHRHGMACGVVGRNFAAPENTAASPARVSARAAARVPGSLLRYRLAVAATEEYVAAVGAGNINNAYLEIINAVNRVNEIYERDLGIRLQLVSDESLLENGFNVSFSDGNPGRMFDENQEWIDSQLGSGAYDIGHLFSTQGGGLASLGSVCDRNDKARGVTGIPSPTGDPFYIDFVAHEIGHQFNAEHSFNGTTSVCGSGRNALTAFEPGSGSTIMAYASLCGVEDLQLNSDATFHAGSIAEINAFTNGSGGSCGTRISAGNANEPVITSGAGNFVIPANTAFRLQGSATDADGNLLTYQWDQMDNGCPTDARSYGTDIGSNALFRSFLPRTEGFRNFPALGTQLRGLYDNAEVIPCNARDLNFRLTARDQRSGQSAVNIAVSVVNTGATFEILQVNGGSNSIDATAAFDVTWNPAGTAAAPISCPNVILELLAFSGSDYSAYTAYSLGTVPNTGAANVMLPVMDRSHPRARIRASCASGIFYDISPRDLTVNGTTLALLDDDDIPVFTNHNNGTTETVPRACGTPRTCFIPSSGSGSGGGGGGAVAPALLMGLMLLLGVVSRRRG